jgi:hypothetical protein
MKIPTCTCPQDVLCGWCAIPTCKCERHLRNKKGALSPTEPGGEK